MRPTLDGFAAEIETVGPETGGPFDVFHGEAAQLHMRTLAGVNDPLSTCECYVANGNHDEGQEYSCHSGVLLMLQNLFIDGSVYYL